MFHFVISFLVLVFVLGVINLWYCNINIKYSVCAQLSLTVVPHEKKISDDVNDSVS